MTGLLTLAAACLLGALSGAPQQPQQDPASFAKRGYERAAAGDREGAAAEFASAMRAQLREWDQHLARQPDDVRARRRRAFLHTELGQYDAALEDYTRAVALQAADAHVWFERGNARYRAGDRKGAIDDYDRAIELNPRLPEVYVARAAARAALGDVNGAAADLAAARGLHPDDTVR